jgi:hypothetical protein
MMMISVLWIAYALIALIFLLFVLVEGRRSRSGWTPLRIAGVLACTVWPLALLVVLAIVLAEKSRTPATRQRRTPVATERPLDRVERHYRRAEPERRLRQHGVR